MRIRSLLHRRTSSFPRSVKPGPVSGDDGHRNGRPLRTHWPAPDWAEGTEAGGTQDVQHFETRVDGFRAFHVKDDCEHAIFHALRNVTYPVADTNAAVGLCLDPQQQ